MAEAGGGGGGGDRRGAFSVYFLLLFISFCISSMATINFCAILVEVASLAADAASIFNHSFTPLHSSLGE